jgi:hypothetical protein
MSMSSGAQYESFILGARPETGKPESAMDTDSAMIISTKDGGLVPCAGGPHRLENYRVPSGHAAIRAKVQITACWDESILVPA